MATDSGFSIHPPRPTPRLTIALAGHRAIDAEQLPAIEGSLRAVLGEAIERGTAIAGAGRVGVLSQLAAGGDQIASDVAHALGARLDVILPFDEATHLENFDADEQAGFERLRAEAATVWTLPSSRHDVKTAYALAGSLMLGQSDLLVAIWDGAHARGPGGTADVVDEAVRRGIPVVHVPIDGTPPRLMWAAIEGIGAPGLDSGSVPTKQVRPGDVARTVGQVLLPPAEPVEAAALADYLAEREWRVRPRLEYPVLLALARIRPFSWANLRSARYAVTTRAEWAPFTDPLHRHEVADRPGTAELERAFCWADRLADHYAQTYRSGVIFNYLAAAMSVIVALIGVLAPTAKPILLTIELLLIGGIVVNTWVGNRRCWHRRWLDYRSLAEQLRPMRSLKLIGAPTTAEAWSAREEGGRWTDWYAATLWRAMDLPPTLTSQVAVHDLARHILAEEIQPQIAYHRANAHRMHLLDHRLHKTGTALFVATIAVSLLGLIGYVAGLGFLSEMGKLLTVLSAALPTLGSALFGIRGQSDFSGAARRSSATAARLSHVADRMGRDPLDLPVSTRLIADAGATMAADLGEWRTSYIDRKLAIPA